MAAQSYKLQYHDCVVVVLAMLVVFVGLVGLVGLKTNRYRCQCFREHSKRCINVRSCSQTRIGRQWIFNENS